MKNKTAVEWLIEQISKDFFERPCCIKSETVQQAIEMEKQQITDAWFDGCANFDSEKDPEQYYSETFKK